MGLYFMDSEKSYQNEYWSNRYVISAATLAEAVAVAADIRAIERASTYNVALLTKYRVSTSAAHDDVYQIVNDNVAGSKIAGSATLPLFCRIRFDFNAFGGGRPSRKYWCPPLTEDEVADGVLNSTALAAYNTSYLQPLVALGEFVDVDAQAFTSGSIFPKVAMRQLRRGSKRKLLPIIP